MTPLRPSTVAMLGPCVLWTIVLTTAAWAEESQARSEAFRFFETKVRPLLAARCFKCHGPQKQQGGLRLDSQAGVLAGGESGAVIVPGSPRPSLLIEAVHYRSLEMPPDGKLSDQQIGVLTQWVRMGVPWPGAGDVVPRPRQTGFWITDEDRQFWSFQPIRRPPVPNAVDTDWDDENPIDGFILDKLREHGFRPAPAATQRELVRRIFLDLIGLPPTPAEVQRFLADGSPRALSRLVDQLLSRPQYGERWARHWLDVVRFAQTNGYERDAEKPFAWRYRDYVVRALNSDKPFDRFIVEQLAGDEIADATHDSIIATGFYRLGVWDDEPDDKQAALYEDLDDILRTTGETFLGLTIGCARCHDHKFDPIPQADYYRMLAFVRNVSPYGKDVSETHWALNPDAVYTPLTTRESLARWRITSGQLAVRIAALKKQLDAAKGDARQQLEQDLKDLEKQQAEPPFDRALSVREPSSEVPVTKVLIRGNHLTPGEPVRPAFLTVFESEQPNLKPADGTPSQVRDMLRELGPPTSGRRRALAGWIASRENPLAARVIANRVWHYHFGRGIVSTPNDFGHTGQPPSHPRLLDWLASELIRNGWSLKHLHRLVVTSRTYRLSSSPPGQMQFGNPQSSDPGNTLYWRQNLRRLDAESLRDAMLAVSGDINLEMGGRGIFPRLSAGVLSSQSRPGSGWDESDDAQLGRRSVYIYVKRTLGVPIMEAFDTPVPDKAEPARQTTTVAPQALMLLNSDFVSRQARSLAKRLLQETDGSPRSCIDRAYWLVPSARRGPRSSS